jgi:hypothetical protein
MLDTDVILKRFDNPDELRTFDKGIFELIEIGGITIGRATYQPGWRWSEHVGAAIGELHCHVEHLGMVVSGCATAAMANGEIVEMHPGDVFYVPPSPHDSWVVNPTSRYTFWGRRLMLGSKLELWSISWRVS